MKAASNDATNVKKRIMPKASHSTELYTSIENEINWSKTIRNYKKTLVLCIQHFIRQQ